MNNRDKIFPTVLAAHILYGLLFIVSTSYLIGGVRYFSLFDDAMISMRYAENLAHGYGAVFNPGCTPVEGYTNPLWMLVMSVFHFLPVGKEQISLFFQLLNLGLSVTNLYFVNMLTKVAFPGSNRIRAFSLVLVAFYYPLNFWFLMGMESGAVALVTTASIYYIIVSKKFSAKSLILPSIGILLRPDVALIFGCLAMWQIYLFRSDTKRIVFYSILALIVTLGGTTLFRFLYYGELLPNTYYLKVEGVDFLYRLGRGLFVSAKYITFFNPLLFLIPLYVAWRTKTSISRFVCMLIGVLLAYSSYVGGDAWDWWGGANRFVAPAMPAFFVLLAAGLTNLMDKSIRLRISNKLFNVVFVSVAVLVLVQVNFTRNLSSVEEWLLMEPALGVEDNERHTRLALLVRSVSRPGESIAVVTAGVLPYFAEREAVDLLGKSDSHISRVASRRLDGCFSFAPGHTKWDYSYSIGELQPDWVVQLWKNPSDAEPYLSNYSRMDTLGFVLYHAEFSKKTCSSTE